MERELITQHEANLLMIAALVIAPLIGFGWGKIHQRAGFGFALGLGIGIGNLLLWGGYNAITDHLGLDTVKNLLVNLALFAAVGAVAGGAAAFFGARVRKGKL